MSPKSPTQGLLKETDQIMEQGAALGY